MSIKQIIKDLEQAKKDLRKEAVKISNKHKAEILDYIREKQLFNLGIDGNGNRLLEYTEYTKALKRQKGQPTNRTTLEDSGDFYKGFGLFLTDQYSIGVFSRDQKTAEIVEKYGSDIFLFTEKNIKEIDEQIYGQNLIEWLLKTKAFTIT